MKIDNELKVLIKRIFRDFNNRDITEAEFNKIIQESQEHLKDVGK